MEKNSSKSFIGNMILLSATAIWGFAFAAQDTVGNYLTPFIINAIRSLIAFLFLILVLPLTDRMNKNGRKTYSFGHRLPFDLTKRELLGGMVVGAFLFLATDLQQFGLNDAETGPGKAAFLTALYIVIVPVLGIFTKKKAGVQVWIAVVIALVGAYFLTAADEGSFVLKASDIVLILCAVAFSFQICSIDWLGESVDGVRLSLVQFFTTAVLNLPFVFLTSPTENGYTLMEALSHSILPLLFLGIISSGIAYTLQIIGQQLSETPAVASLTMSMESVFGAIGGIVISGEVLSTNEWIGCGVIFFAVIFVQFPWNRLIHRDLP